jgi:hypothetical protein
MLFELWFLMLYFLGKVLFTAVIMSKFFFELIGINAFMIFFLVQKLCLQTVLLPKLDKELRNQLLTDCTVCNHNRSYLSEIFSA